MRRQDLPCEDLNARFVDFVNGELEPRDAERFRRHLDSCPACRDEVDSLGAVWHALGELSEEEPSDALRRRFYTVLEAYQEGRRSRRGSLERLSEWIAGWWPRQPMAQVALTAAALVVGLVGGARWAADGGGQLDVLRTEVASLNRLVSLSLLHDESASSRLQGVSYSRRAAADDEIARTLVEVLNHDENPAVRLAAVDALARFAERPSVAGELRDSLLRQGSPLVQIALADLLVELDGPDTRRSFRELLERDDLDETVRSHIRGRLGSEV